MEHNTGSSALNDRMFSFIDGDRKITVGLETDIALTGRESDGFTVYDGSGKAVSILSVADKKTGADAVRKTRLVEIRVGQDLDVTGCYRINHAGFADSNAAVRHILDEDAYFYGGDDLGCTYAAGRTDFRLWAPTAEKVQVCLFLSSEDEKSPHVAEMQRAENGTWKCGVPGNFDGAYYQYRVTHYVDGALVTDQVNDPYSCGSSANSGRSLVYEHGQTNPPGWEDDRFIPLRNPVDAIIYEAHVRDLTISASAGLEQADRGKYLGLTRLGTKSPQGETTGLDHLKELGITHVELMPTYDYGNGDETEPNTGYTWYNWGYDPVLYNTPEGSYATDPNGTARQKEYKQMVSALHQNGIGIIFDAVFNHTSHTGSHADSVFDRIVPGYYYRVGNDGVYSSGSGCGNDVASERPMVRKFILDSAKYWVREYHLDGLRFDLMGLLDVETMRQVCREVKDINPNILVFGEGWNIPTLLSEDRRMIQANIPGTGVGVFNDGIRDDVRGSVFDDAVKGFAYGGGLKSASRFASEIAGQSVGSDGIPLESPNRTINYAACHDNMNLWDRICISNADDSEDERMKMQALTNAVILTSQGVPFLAEGDEFCRSKKGDRDSYRNNDPEVNPIDWSLKSRNKNLYVYYQGLIALRKAHPAFRMSGSADVKQHLKFIEVSRGIVRYAIEGHANGDAWATIYVAYNGGSTSKTFDIKGIWTLVVHGSKAGTESLGTAEQSVTVPAYSTLVMYQNPNQ